PSCSTPSSRCQLSITISSTLLLGATNFVFSFGLGWSGGRAIEDDPSESRIGFSLTHLSIRSCKSPVETTICGPASFDKMRCKACVPSSGVKLHSAMLATGSALVCCWSNLQPSQLMLTQGVDPTLLCLQA